MSIAILKHNNTKQPTTIYSYECEQIMNVGLGRGQFDM